MKTYFVTIDGESKGPFTTDQIYAMWNSGRIAADSFFYDDQEDTWQPIADFIDSFKPKSGLQKLLEPPSLTEEEKFQVTKNQTQATGYASIFIALVCFGFAFSQYGESKKDYIIEASYVKTPVTNPPKVFRDIYRIYTPEQEREYQQKVLDSKFKVVKKEEKRKKTDGEKSDNMMNAGITVLIGIFFLFAAATNLLKRAKRPV